MNNGDDIVEMLIEWVLKNHHQNKKFNVTIDENNFLVSFDE